MSRREIEVVGPSKPESDDIGELNELFSEAFTERYRRDGLVGVRVPKLSTDIWRYALRNAGDGAMVWRDPEGSLVAFNIVHQAGAEGWMGPLAVRDNCQSRGVGSEIVRAGVEWLKRVGATTIGLETMPRTVDNIGFYSHLSFRPVHLTVTMVGRAVGGGKPVPHFLLGDVGASERESFIVECARILASSGLGCDFSFEMRLTEEMNLGDTVIVEREGKVCGFALYHSASLVEGRPSDELRLLKLYAVDHETLLDLCNILEFIGADLGLHSVAIRCQSRFSQAYDLLIDRSYRVRWTDLRMVLSGYEEPPLPESKVLFSNWEI